jgi:hypothetical protein
MSYRILSIDAWAGAELGSWEWNEWHHVGDIDNIPATNDEIIKLFIAEGYLKETAFDKVFVEDDQYNFVIRVKKDDCPLWAIEYGNKL